MCGSIPLLPADPAVTAGTKRKGNGLLDPGVVFCYYDPVQRHAHCWLDYLRNRHEVLPAYWQKDD